MAKLGDLIAFRAAISLLEENNLEHIIDEVYERCKEQLDSEMNIREMKNYVRMIYEPFTAVQLSAKIADLVRPKEFNADLQIIFQRIEDLHSACPNHRGDWYFSGNYPTPGEIRFLQGVCELY
jgi:amidophosphoribosyltransferase